LTTTPLSKSDFFGLDEVAWLFTGAESPLHKGVHAAVNEYLEQRTRGPQGRVFNAQIEESCRAQFAQLLGTEAQNIALLSNASEAISTIILALRLQPGENIVLHDLEYPSAVLSTLALREFGVEMRVAPHQNWQVSNDELLALVDEKTRLVVTSHVSYISGTRFDYQALHEKLQSTNALLMLDATQSLGVVPVEMRHADFVISSTYKWLLGLHGAGVLAINPQRTKNLVPILTGWRSVENVFSPRRFEIVERYADARRFELGYPAFTTIAALNFSLGVLLKCGIANIEKHILDLGEKTIAGLQEMNLQVMTPSDEKFRAGNVAFVCERGEEIAAQLAVAGVLCWGGDGRLRLSMHGFNDESDIERALNEIKKALSK
jgi:selenocysteine lyase/cysteine desulfurase